MPTTLSSSKDHFALTHNSLPAKTLQNLPPLAASQRTWINRGVIELVSMTPSMMAKIGRLNGPVVFEISEPSLVHRSSLSLELQTLKNWWAKCSFIRMMIPYL